MLAHILRFSGSRCPPVAPPISHLRSQAGIPTGLALRFARDEGGNVMMVFGLLFTIMLLFIGAAVDFGRWQHARTQTWQALDAAVLAGARTLQLNGKTPDLAATAAQLFYNDNTKSRQDLTVDTISFVLTDNDTAITATGAASISTIFLRLMGITELPLFNATGTQLPKSKLAVGGNGEASIEIAMMLDITGSMGGSKISDLKSAAKNMIDIVVWQDQGEFTSRVALVPFSEAVDVGSAYATAVRGSRPSMITVNSDWFSSTYKLTTCVSERPGVDYAFTDDPPSAAYVGPVYTWSGGCTPTSKIMPLTSDTAALKNAIDNYSASGSTAGHIGTAWAWYMLSPKWNEVWPAASHAGSYEDVRTMNRFGNPKLRKIAVLMTDGEYNLQYCANGVDDNTENCGTPLGNATAQGRQLCTAMKNAGITVYTIGFQVSQSSKEFLQYCSSGGGYYYDAADGNGLKQAFTDIAIKISSLYLSQ